MKKLRSLIMLVSFSVWLCGAVQPAKPDVRKIVEKAEAMRAPNFPYETKVTIRDYEKDKTQGPSRIYLSKVDPKEGALVEFLEPSSDLGKKMLMVEDHMWLKFPTSANPVRVSARQKLTGQASNGDVVSISYVKNYSPKYLAKVREGENELHHIELRAIPGKLVTYETIEYFVDVKTNKPVKAIFKTKSGKVLRTGYYQDFKELEGVSRPTKIVIESALDQGKKTEIIFSSYKRQTFSSLIFKRAYLDR